MYKSRARVELREDVIVIRAVAPLGAAGDAFSPDDFCRFQCTLFGHVLHVGVRPDPVDRRVSEEQTHDLVCAAVPMLRPRYPDRSQMPIIGRREPAVGPTASSASSRPQANRPSSAITARPPSASSRGALAAADSPTQNHRTGSLRRSAMRPGCVPHHFGTVLLLDLCNQVNGPKRLTCE
jgi:hypothetical protein